MKRPSVAYSVSTTVAQTLPVTSSRYNHRNGGLVLSSMASNSNFRTWKNISCDQPVSIAGQYSHSSLYEVSALPQTKAKRLVHPDDTMIQQYESICVTHSTRPAGSFSMSNIVYSDRNSSSISFQLNCVISLQIKIDFATRHNRQCWEKR